KPMIVQVGRPFTLSLASNPTTGYHWQFATPLDEMHLKLLKAEYKKPESNWAGNEGTEIWEFKPLAEGETQIQLKYARPWETDAAPVHTTNFLVKIVKKAGV
ncbi:MAG TPA: protease inhibitor I42 family protein, partial [Bacillota bacterium]|nr:protease inhibitor I42 family protein [Bacillota bacterium]